MICFSNLILCEYDNSKVERWRHVGVWHKVLQQLTKSRRSSLDILSLIHDIEYLIFSLSIGLQNLIDDCLSVSFSSIFKSGNRNCMSIFLEGLWKRCISFFSIFNWTFLELNHYINFWSSSFMIPKCCGLLKQ